MPVFPLSQLQMFRPDWAPLNHAECMVLPEGTRIGPVFNDAPLLFALLEGPLVLRDGGERFEMEAGEVAAVASGRSFHLEVGETPAVVLRMQGEPFPPFRQDDQPMGAPASLSLSPISPKRRGSSMSFDESATFSPHLITAALGGDLMLQMNLGAVGKLQAREIRRACDESGRAVAAIIVRVEDEEDPVQFLLDRHRWEMARDLKPFHLGVEADLATDRGRLRAETYRRGWQRRFMQEGLEYIVVMPWRSHTEDERRAFLEYLAQVPPAHLKLALRLKETKLSIAERRYLRALLPWLRIIAVRANEGYPELCHYFDGAGFQGWVLQEF